MLFVYCCKIIEDVINTEVSKMVKRGNQVEHDRMVQSVVNYIKEQGHFDIRADLKRFNTPALIYWETTGKGYIPDVTSKNIRSYIFEVETDDSIDNLHVENEWRLFWAHAKQTSKAFIVVVPEGSEQRAWQRAMDLGIDLDNVWTIV